MEAREERLPSLTGNTVLRGLRLGRFYLAIGSVMTLLLSIILLRAKAGVFATTFPLELPLFAVLGGMGGLMLFTADRVKGVYEYQLAYGVRPRTIFLNVVATATALSTIVLGVGLAVGLGGYVAEGNTISMTMAQALLLYAVPMTYAGGLFAAMGGMVWSSLSTPRMGLNSPVGVAPFLGIGPLVLVLIAAEASPMADYYFITAGAAGTFLALVVVMLVLSSRVLGQERLLSPV